MSKIEANSDDRDDPTDVDPRERALAHVRGRPKDCPRQEALTREARLRTPPAVSFHIASSEEFSEMMPNIGGRTIEIGSTRQRFGRNPATEVIKSAVDRRFGKRRKDLVGSERPRRTARHGRDEAALVDGSFPGFAVELFGSVTEYGALIGFTLRLLTVIVREENAQPSVLSP